MKRNKGFSLIEMLVSLAIGSVLASGMLAFSHMALSNVRRQEGLFKTLQDLGLAQTELVLALRGREDAFWEAFPRVQDLVHDSDHQHGALQWAERCAQQSGASCVTVWDLHPRITRPEVFLATAGTSPNQLVLRGATSAKLAAMDVLLVEGPSETKVALVAAVTGERVTLARAAMQPWAVPDVWPPGQLRALNLGQLEVWHLTLGANDGSGRHLRVQPWSLRSGSWDVGRAYTMQAELAGLLWEGCSEEQPDRLALIAQRPNAVPLLEPIVIAGEPFNQEVDHVWLEF